MSCQCILGQKMMGAENPPRKHEDGENLGEKISSWDPVSPILGRIYSQ